MDETVCLIPSRWTASQLLHNLHECLDDRARDERLGTPNNTEHVSVLCSGSHLHALHNMEVYVSTYFSSPYPSLLLQMASKAGLRWYSGMDGNVGCSSSVDSSYSHSFRYHLGCRRRGSKFHGCQGISVHRSHVLHASQLVGHPCVHVSHLGLHENQVPLDTDPGRFLFCSSLMSLMIDRVSSSALEVWACLSLQTTSPIKTGILLLEGRATHS